DNSNFGWDEHRQLVVAKDVSHKEASQFRHRTFPYYDQLTAIYAKDKATGKDAQTAATIIEEIDAKDLHNRNHLETKMIPHFQRKKKIFLMQVNKFLLLHLLMLPRYWRKIYEPLALQQVGALPPKC
ncbi:hypothetical protein Gotri_003900, partial [Gossypium trilobum]|nr:hypothetical protein [Gossypium trilobum]